MFTKRMFTKGNLAWATACALGFVGLAIVNGSPGHHIIVLTPVTFIGCAAIMALIDVAWAFYDGSLDEEA